METVKTMSLRSLPANYDNKKSVRILDNGKKIFLGVVSAIPKSFKSATLDRTCDVFDTNENIINVYLQRKVK